MRDIVETELLIRDFASDPSLITVWRNSSEDERRRLFTPVRMRERQAKILGVPRTEVPGAGGYRAHSQLLHVGPPLLFPRSPGPGTEAGLRAAYVLDGLADIMSHGGSAVEGLNLLLSALNRSSPDPGETLAALAAAFDDTYQAHEAVVTIERRAAESLPTDGNWTAVLFESGLVIAFDTGNPPDKYLHD
jgi:hypothetical protein